MSEILWTSVVVLLALAFVYFGGHLMWMLVMIARGAWQSTFTTFLARIEQGDELGLRAEYPERKLYRMLCRAERAAGYRTRPMAMEVIDEFDAMLDELARRARGNPVERVA